MSPGIFIEYQSLESSSDHLQMQSTHTDMIGFLLKRMGRILSIDFDFWTSSSEQSIELPLQKVLEKSAIHCSRYLITIWGLIHFYYQVASVRLPP